MQTQNQNLATILNLSVSSNDDDWLNTFEDIAHLIDGRPILPRKAYSEKEYGYQDVSMWHDFKKYRFAKGEYPVLIRGARWRMVDRWSTHSGYWGNVCHRFIRMKKISITTKEEADKWETIFNKWAFNKGMDRNARRLISVGRFFDQYFGEKNPSYICLNGKTFETYDWQPSRWEALRKLETVYKRFCNER